MAPKLKVAYAFVWTVGLTGVGLVVYGMISDPEFRSFIFILVGLCAFVGGLIWSAITISEGRND